MAMAKSSLADRSLEDQLQSFLQSSMMTADDKEKREKVLDELTSLFRKTFPDCHLYPYGSYLTGTGDKDSDLDVYVDLHGITPLNRLRTDGKMMGFYRIHKILQKEDDHYSNIFDKPNAIVPIITVTDTQTKIQLDLSFENILGARRGELVVLFTKHYPILRPLLIIVQHWAKINDLAGQRKFKNYALSLLVLCFLMRKGELPTVAQLHLSCVHDKIMDDCWTKAVEDFFERKSTPANQNPSANEILQLAEDFFKLFGCMDFQELAISPVIGRIIPRYTFRHVHDEQGYKILYKYGLDYPFLKDEWRCRDPVFVEDIFNLGSNLTCSVTKQDAIRFERLSGFTARKIFRMRNAVNSNSSVDLMNIF